MAHESDSEDFIFVSGARSGHKREFAFALKNQSDLNISIGRTQGLKAQSIVSGDEVGEISNIKRFKPDDVKGESKSDQIDLIMVSSDEKSTKDEVKSTCMEESNPDLGKSVTAENNAVTIDPEKPSVEEDGKVEAPMVIDETPKPKPLPPRRFTRSLLKSKVEPVEMDTSSGSTVDSEDECKSKDEGRLSDAISPLKTSSQNRLGMKMSKKIACSKFLVTVKDLLDTGLLEGMPVKYLSWNKREGLQGMIKNGGILCSCAECQGRRVVAANQFEKHAGSSYKHPANSIYLENGKSLRDVLNACKNVPLEACKEIIKNESFHEVKLHICQNCKAPLSEPRTAKTTPLCESCLGTDNSLASQCCLDVSRSRLSESDSMSKFSGHASGCASSHVKTKGKITKKDVRLHKLVFEEDGLPDGTELAYYARGEKLVEGYKLGVGIYCYHCSSEVSPSQFEAHAGYAARRKPYLNIYTSNGVSLHELSISLSKGRKISNIKNDDLCTYCTEFGDLLCCDMCPRSFHRDCVGLSSTPDGKWYCPYCINMYEREKHCENNANAKAAGRVSGVDPIEQITRRCIRIVETSEVELGGCVICRRRSFSNSGFGPSTVMICDQCECEYHVSCLKDNEIVDLKELPEGKWFCCPECDRIHTAMHKLIVHGYEKLPDPLIRVIKKKEADSHPNSFTDFDVRWRVLNSKMDSPDSKSLLSEAIMIFNDQFSSIIDPKTGRDFVPAMVYGKGLGNQEFGGMYTAVLTVNSRVVSAGLLRIFGHDVVEIPLVATRRDKQGRGYFQTLLTCIEKLLGFLQVKNIVLPSAVESKAIWTDRFGFSTIPPDELSQLRDKYQMMIFQGTSMLQKPVPKVRILGKPIKSS